MGEHENLSIKLPAVVSDVKSIREKFEAQTNVVKKLPPPKNIKKVPPAVPQKPVLFRNKTMRDSLMMQHRKALRVPEVEVTSKLSPNESSLFTNVSRNSDGNRVKTER